MPSIQRPLGGDVLLFDLRAEHDRTPVVVPPGRSARTLVKDGPIRVTLVRIAPGGSIAEHSAPGPVTIQPLSGTITVTTEGAAHVLEPGQLLALRAGVRHAVACPPDSDGEFLLTLAHPPRPAPEQRT